MKRVLDDRLLLSEAIEAVQTLVEAYPNGGANGGDGYIGSLASVLCQYPRLVSVRCADPLRGVSRETKFLPTVADLVVFCERETAPLRRDCAREDRISAQLAARNEGPPHSESLLEKTHAWLDRRDPDAVELTSIGDQTLASRKAATLDQIKDANNRVFARDCERAGIDPTRGVSPSLLKALEEKRSETVRDAS